MKHIFKQQWLGYTLGLLGLGLLIAAMLAVLGPSTGNIFSNIYANVGPYPQASPANPPAPTDNTASKPEAPTTSPARSAGVLASPYRTNRLIIKNAEMNLLTEDVDRAVDQIINIAVSSGGYVIGERTWAQDNLKFAAITIGVPTDQFEIVQRQVRAVGAKILSATSSGQDVSDEYVDLEARQRNLEATAARIREFLSQAQDAEQALQVNAKLSEVESEIELIKGRLTYLKDRSAYSTMTINLEAQRPTPTPTPTLTPTPTATPVGWQPEKTLTAATGALSTVLQGLADAAIWLIAFVAPLVVPMTVVVLGVMWFRRRRAKRVVRNA